MLTLLALIAVAAPAQAGPLTWSPVFLGVEHAVITRAEPVPLVAHALRVDLSAEGIAFVATPGNDDAPEETDGETTRAFLAEHRLQAAINTHFFGPCCAPTPGQPKDLRGLAVADGQLVSPAENDQKRAGDVLLLANGVAAIAPSWAESDPMPDIACAGEILFTSAAATEWPPEDAFANDRHPRTLIGIGNEGRTVLLVVIDGRHQGTSEGASLAEAAAIMRELGCTAALNLDGGGSTTMVLHRRDDGNPRVVNRPSGGERVVGSNLGFRARPTP